MTSTDDKPRMTFGKKEHVVSKKTLEKLFSGGNRSMVAYPIRMVYMADDSGDEPVKVMVSVSKRHFKRAVKRNRVKRQIREAYRRQKAVLVEAAAKADKPHTLAFIYMSDNLLPSSTIDESIGKLLQRLSEKISLKYEADKAKAENEEFRI